MSRSAVEFQGQVEGLVLAVLGRGPLHVYAIAAEIRERSDGMLEVAEGTLYPVLHKLDSVFVSAPEAAGE